VGCREREQSSRATREHVEGDLTMEPGTGTERGKASSPRQTGRRVSERSTSRGAARADGTGRRCVERWSPAGRAPNARAIRRLGGCSAQGARAGQQREPGRIGRVRRERGVQTRRRRAQAASLLTRMGWAWAWDERGDAAPRMWPKVEHWRRWWTGSRLHDQGEYVAAHTIQRTPRPAIDPWPGALEARLSQRAQCRLERPAIQRPPPASPPLPHRNCRLH
jgi:hypothetical protein